MIHTNSEVFQTFLEYTNKTSSAEMRLYLTFSAKSAKEDPPKILCIFTSGYGRTHSFSRLLLSVSLVVTDSV